MRALEDSNTELKEIKEAIKACDEKIERFNDRLTGLQVKVAAIGGTAGLITSIILLLLTKI